MSVTSGSGPIRGERPLNIHGEVGMPSGLGVGASYNVSPHFSLDGSASTLVLTEDVSVGGTFYPLKGSVTPTLGVRAHALVENYNTLLGGPKVMPGASVRLGLDWSAGNGFQLGAYAGAAAYYDRTFGTVNTTPELGVTVGFRFP